MIEYTNSRPLRIVGPCREVLTRDDLPPPDTTRWVARRKAQVVAAVESGLLTIDEVLRRYNLSHEEFYGWQHALHSAGVAGLRISWAQHERAAFRRRSDADRPRPLQLA